MADNEPQATLRDTLEASIAAVTEPDTPAQSSTETPASAAPTETTEQTEQRTRDEKGKFVSAKTEVKPTAAEPQKPTSNLPPVQAQPEVPAAVQATRPQGCPSSWPKEMWGHWSKMNSDTPLTPQEARQVAEFNARRESQFATGVSTYKQIADSAKPLMEAIQPFQADLEKHGIAAPEMVHRLMSAHRSLAMGSPQQKLQLFGKLAQDYGIPIQALYDQTAQQQYLMSAPHTQPVADPTPQLDIPSLVRQELMNAKINETVESMQSNREKYPFFNYVRPTMAQLLETGEATDLEDAYAKALESPDHAMLTQVMQQQQSQAAAQAAEAQRVATAQATAKAARANIISPRSATPASAGVTDGGKKGVRDALREAIGMHVGGARV